MHLHNIILIHVHGAVHAKRVIIYIIIKQVIKTFSMREGRWYIGIKGDGGVKSKGTRLLIEKENEIDLY